MMQSATGTREDMGKEATAESSSDDAMHLSPKRTQRLYGTNTQKQSARCKEPGTACNGAHWTKGRAPAAKRNAAVSDTNLHEKTEEKGRLSRPR